MKPSNLNKIATIITLILTLTATVLAAPNNPGHDTLYVEQTGDSSITGSLNITNRLTAENLLWIKSYLDILGNGTSISGTVSRPTIQATATELDILTNGLPLYLNRYGAGTVYTGSPGVRTDLNVSGNIYIYNPTGTSTLTIGNVNICLANGTNCQAISGSNSGGGWTNTTTFTATKLDVNITNSSGGGVMAINGSRIWLFANDSTIASPSTFTIDDTILNALYIRSFADSSSSGAIVRELKARGTKESPLRVQSGDTIGGINIFGAIADNNTLPAALTGLGQSQGQLRWMAAQDFNVTARGTYWTLTTTPLGSNVSVERIRITSEGLVGIGTTTPSHNLSITGTTNTTDLIINSLTSANCDVKSYTNGTLYCGSDATGSGSGGNITSQGTTGYIAQFQNNTLLNNTVIYQNGSNIGIGTTSPGYKLQVSSTTAAIASFYSATDPARLIIDTAGTNVGFGLSSIGSQKWSNAIYDANGGNLEYTIYNDQTTTSSILIDGTSNQVDIAGNVVGAKNVSGVSLIASTSICLAGNCQTSWPSGSGLGNITSTGTSGYIALFQNNTLVNNSGIYQTGSNIGIGTSTPYGQLSVIGNDGVHISKTNVDSGAYLQSVLPSNLAFGAGTNYNGSSWIAKNDSSSIISMFAGNINFYGNTGLTVGTGYTATQTMILTNTGRLGINTVTPSHTLSITGTTNTTDLIINSLTSANCDVKSYTNGTLYCGSDATGSGLGNITSTGTSGYIALFQNNTLLNNSIVSQSGNTLTIAGNVSLANGFWIGNSGQANATYTVAIGYQPKARGTESIAIGDIADANSQYGIAMSTSSKALADYAIALGGNSNASGASSIAIGGGISANPTIAVNSYAIAIGYNALSNATGTIAIGSTSKAGKNYGISIGYNAYSADYSIAIGTSTQASSGTSLAIGQQALALNTDAVALGKNANASGISALAVGSGTSGARAENNWAIAIGDQAVASSVGSIAIGRVLSSAQSLSIGDYTNTTTSYAIAIGYTNLGQGSDSIVIGRNNNATHSDTIVLGRSAVSTQANLMVVGSTVSSMDARIFGKLNVTSGNDICIEGGNCLSTRGAANGNITSIGTTGYVALFQNNTLINNSQIYQNGVNVGINTTTPSQILTLNGNMNITAGCIYAPGGGRLCGNTSCITLYSPNGNGKVEACN